MMKIYLHHCRRQCSRYVFIFGMTVCLLLITYGKYNSHNIMFRRMALELGRLNNNDQTFNTNLTSDTYFGRTERLLQRNNLSFPWYEQLGSISLNLSREIQHLRKLHHHQLIHLKHGKQRRNGCRESCCWSEMRIPDFYYGDEDRSPSVLDRLSSIDFKLLADVHYGSLPVPDGIRLPELTEEILPCLQNTTIVFVDSTALEIFLTVFHPKIAVDYILITGDSDAACPRNIIHTHTHLLNQIFAGETHIIHWFAINCDVGKNEKWQKSKMFTCIPQGISQWNDQRYYIQLIAGINDSVRNTHLKTDDYWILASFSIRSNPAARKPAWNLACNDSLRHISKCFYKGDSIDQWTYYLHVARSKFVLSPPGAGVDCYRTWEALYLGSIPIIKTSSINSIFERLPVLIMSNYEDLTMEFLKDVYANMTRQSYDYKRLYKGFWQRQINAFRNPPQSIQIRYTGLNDEFNI